MSVDCNDCKREMKQGNGCTLRYLQNSSSEMGIERIRVDFSKEPNRGYFCHDCNAMPGQLHHFGCDCERCPKCGGQLAGCGCWGAELKATSAVFDFPIL